MQQQAVGCGAGLAKNEQVEEVAGEEGTVQSEQLQLEQHMEMPAFPVSAVDGVEQGKRRHGGGDEQHPGGEAVGDEHDAEGGFPVAEAVDEVGAVGGGGKQRDGERHQRERGDQARGPLHTGPGATQRQQHDTRCQRQQDREDGQMNGELMRVDPFRVPDRRRGRCRVRRGL